MGCGVNGCLGKKAPRGPQPIIYRKPGENKQEDPQIKHDDTIVEGVCLREANAGHYFAETELFGVDVSSGKIKQLEYRLDKWWAMCTYGRPPALPRIFLKFIFKGEDPDVKQKCIVPGLTEQDAEFSLIKYAQREPHVFHRRLVKGPPPIYRWVSWKVALNVREHRIEGLYSKLKEQKNAAKWLKTIQKDLDRTFPTHPLFGESVFKEKGQVALENILTIFSMYCPNVGYCQGMNFVVGFMLIISGFQEEDTFWTFTSLMKNKIQNDSLQVNGLEGLYSENFPLLRILQELFNSMLTKISPIIKEHIQNIEIPEVLWLHKWLSTLFIYSMPISHCIRFWDYIFANGISGLLKLSVTILKQNKQEILTSDFSGCCDLFKRMKEGRGLVNAEKIILAADKLSVDWTFFENQRKEIMEHIQKEENERLLILKKEESKQKLPDPSNTPTKIQLRMKEELKFDNSEDQRGKKAENTKPDIAFIRNRARIKHKHILRNSKMSNKALNKNEVEESLKLPPIIDPAKKQFIFANDSNGFFSDDGDVLSDDNNEHVNSGSFRCDETPEKQKTIRRKSTNSRFLYCSRSTHDLRFLPKDKYSLPKNKQTETLQNTQPIKNSEMAPKKDNLLIAGPIPNPKPSPSPDRVFDVSPTKQKIQTEVNSERILDKINDKPIISQSFDEQERGGRENMLMTDKFVI